MLKSGWVASTGRKSQLLKTKQFHHWVGEESEYLVAKYHQRYPALSIGVFLWLCFYWYCRNEEDKTMLIIYVTSVCRVIMGKLLLLL